MLVTQIIQYGMPFCLYFVKTPPVSASSLDSHEIQDYISYKPLQPEWSILRNAYRSLVRKPKGNRPLGRHRHRWEDNIRMDLGK
jgi:hypothetical protein